FLVGRDYRKAMLVHDLNKADNYTSTLASAFSSAYQQQVGDRFPYTNLYQSPGQHLDGTKRDRHMKDQFAGMRTSICTIHPDVIVFAGRSTDLTSFMHALSEGGACPFDSLDVVTGDDGATIAGTPLPASDYLRFRVFYTGLAHGAQWDTTPKDSPNRQNYDAFAQKFLTYLFSQDDLADGHAMMSHDAALTAITAIRRNSVAVSNPSTVRAAMLGFRCTDPIPGASGAIALEQNGNPTNKAMPIVQIQPDGRQKQEDLAWPLGAPTDPSSLSTCG
ncbi:MAG TPA: amino acid ABC transporter substrate-binding protein, partial [Candidatus Limnocylindria bacterium]|nr:amino acid ABC transporter substrate-binding protein [Candidatus Limnocylindria bacterium]